jgi:basic membrane protein A and related proteins
MKNLLTGLMAATVISLACMVTSAMAGGEPAVLFDLGGKFDKSFNEAAFNGAEQWKKESGKTYMEFEIQNGDQREQALRKFAEGGANPVVAVGFMNADAIAKLADEFPKTNFVIVDMVVEKPNVRSVVFKEQEGSYLVGVLAAMASKTGKGGFVGGMDIPLISKFACGYVGGFKSVKKDGEVFQNMTGDTPAAWNDPVKGGELAKSQIDRGADVIYAAAGQTGLGVLQAAKDAGKLSIGVDSNQNGIQPGSVLTSMLKRVDVAVFNAFNDAQGGKFTAGFNVLGLKEGGVDYAMDDNNKPLVTGDMKAAVEKAKADIIAGTVQVHDFMSDNACPY